MVKKNESNQIFVTVIVAAVVAVITALVTASVVSVNVQPAPQLAPPVRNSGIVNAHQCNADGVCEVVNLSVASNIVSDNDENNQPIRFGSNVQIPGTLSIINEWPDLDGKIDMGFGSELKLTSGSMMNLQGTAQAFLGRHTYIKADSNNTNMSFLCAYPVGSTFKVYRKTTPCS